MTQANWNAEIANVRDSVERMKDHLAWLQLKQAEARPGLPPAFQVYDPTLTDLSNEYSRFLALSAKLHEDLAHHVGRTVPARRARLRKELQRLEQAVHHLNLRPTLGLI